MRTTIIATAFLLASTGLVAAADAPAGTGTRASQPARMNRYFEEARDAFSKKQFDAAARDIRAGAEIVRQEAAEATGKTEAGLTASVEDLRNLADRVEKKSVEDVKVLTREFARANNRLAEHYQKLAAESWKHEKGKETGGALDTATSYFEHAAGWTGEKAGVVVEDARKVSGKLVEGAGWVPKEVGDAIAGLGHGIQGLGERIEPGKSTAGAAGHRPAPAD